ncbi:PQQ-binding-like beta-propeller repeat protein [Methanolobus sp. ZRKC2]|uniref:outer membrane protein assembly factor BamB family protein n=1 Tax=Methanolobus sp. ZRKC2 TaxID=3125783 RepID=UPI00324AA7BE
MRNDIAGMITLTIIISLILLLVTSAASASDWKQFQKDKYNNGVTVDKAPRTYPVENGISWAAQPTSPGLGAGFDSAFIVVDNILYVVGHDHVLRALYIENGTQIWETSSFGGGFQIGSIAAGNGSIFVPTTSGKFFCVNMSTGDVEWIADERIPNPSNPTAYVNYQLNTPVVYEDHRVYFGGWVPESSGIADLCKYHCYYDNGTMCWERNTTTGSGYYWAGAAPIGDYLIYGDEAGKLVSVYKSNGTLREELDVSTEFSVSSDRIRSSISYAEELKRIYFTSEGGYIYSLGLNSNGTFNTTDKQHAYISKSKSTPAVYNGRVYVGSGSVWGDSGAGLFCLNATNLSEIFWVYDNATAIQSSPVVSTAYDDGDGEVYIYFTTNVESGTVYCLNESGIEQWTYTAPPEMNQYTLQGVTISDGWLFYGNDRSYVFGLATPESLGIDIVADFSANVTYGYAPMTVQFTDHSTGAENWLWDFDNDGIVDSTEHNPQFDYTVAGTYNVSLTVTKGPYSDSETKNHYITINDWNPWNDPDSDDGEMITFAEVMEAYNCFVGQTGAPKTGADIDFATVMEMYNAFVSQTQM